LLDINIVAQDCGLCSEKIIKYVRTVTQDDLKREVALDTQQAGIIFAGPGGGTMSRKENIRGCREQKKAPGLP
jgi:hypothetical protein